MHELSIASSILERVHQEALRWPGVRMTRVGVRIGEISGVDPDALAFGFEALVKNTAWEPLPLDITICPRKQRCLSCHHEFVCGVLETACSSCGNEITACIGGDELDIDYIEVDEPWHK